MKKVFKILSLALLILWIAAIGSSIFGRITYTPPANAEKLEIAFDRGFYTFLIIMSILGTLSTVEFSVAIQRFFANQKSLAGKIVLGLSVLTNILLYTSLIVMLLTNSDAVLNLLIAWIISGLACFIALLIASLKNET